MKTKLFFLAALLCGVANTALADPPECRVSSGSNDTPYNRPACMKIEFSHDDSNDAKDYVADYFMYMFQPEVGENKYGRGSWRRVPKSGEPIPGGGHCDSGVVIRQSGRLSYVGYDTNKEAVCQLSNISYTITNPSSAPRPKAGTPREATPPVVPLDAATLAEKLAKLGTEVNAHTDTRVDGLRSNFDNRFDTMVRAQAATDTSQNQQIVDLTRRALALEHGTLMAPTEQDQSALFSMGVEGVSFDELGSGVVGVVAVESNRPNTRWSPVLRVTGGVLNDGQENRSMLGADVGVFRPVLRGGYLNLGVLAGWRGVLSQTRLADYPHAGLAARYRVSNWLALEGRMLFGALSDEQTGDTSGDDAPDLDMAGAVAAMLTF